MTVRQISKELYDRILAAEAERDAMQEELRKALYPYGVAVEKARTDAATAAGLMKGDQTPYGLYFTKDEITGACYAVLKNHWE